MQILKTSKQPNTKFIKEVKTINKEQNVRPTDPNKKIKTKTSKYLLYHRNSNYYNKKNRKYLIGHHIPKHI